MTNCSVFKLVLLAGTLLLLTMVAGCSPHPVNRNITLLVQGDDAYSLSTEGTERRDRWWESFNDPFLGAIINESLSDNLSLKQAAARIAQAIAADKHAASFLYPELSGRITGERKWKGRNKPDDQYTAGLDLSWEIDLWGRLSSGRNAAVHEVLASREDHEAASLLLTALVGETYFQIVEQNLRLKLLEEQITSGQTYLDLIELRFGYGEASVVDVYQQRHLLAATRARVPEVKSILRTLGNRLSVQMGKTPGSIEIQHAADFPELPGLPAAGLPSDLLNTRPDLRHIYNQMLAVDYRVAEAAAARLPKIDLSGAALFTDGFSAKDRVLSLLLEAAAPIFDRERRSSEVDKRKALLQEKLALYSEAYLKAREEVENAIWQEHYQMELLKSLNDQTVIARSNLSETRNRYRQGLTDYLPVLTALQSLQQLEHDILSARRQLISIRILLYRALGGGCPIAGDYKTAASSKSSMPFIREGVIE